MRHNTLMLIFVVLVLAIVLGALVYLAVHLPDPEPTAPSTEASSPSSEPLDTLTSEPPETEPPVIEPPVTTAPPEPKNGWVELNGKRYYYENDVMLTGWLTLGYDTYYLQSDGSMAIGQRQIDGRTCWFGPDGIEILLVNPWNYMPAGYVPEVVDIGNTHKVDVRCQDALAQMLADCRAAGLQPAVASSYRTYEYQTYLFNRKVNYYLDLGYSEAEAKAKAGTSVAVPGTSEHQLGLAVDLVDNANWNLNETQEDMPAQKWLMANSWKYGFILRYPNEKSAVTGIIYEPWHYRYVGKTVAKAVYESGLCLEEYLETLG